MRVSFYWSPLIFVCLTSLSNPALAQSAATPSEVPPPGVDTPTKYEKWQKERAEAANREINPEETRYDGKLWPEGKTLPKNVLRVRLPVTFAEGKVGYDKDGHKVDQGLRLKAGGTGIVMEYGWSDRLSLQLLAQYVTVNKLGIDAGAFRDSDAYKANYNEFVKAAASNLAATAGSGCTSQAECVEKINAGYSLPVDSSFSLPNGEVLNVRKNVPLRDYADSIVINGAKAQYAGDGAKGFGDLTLGLLYEVTDHREPLYFSIGAGFRIPTGKSLIDAGQRPISRSVYEIGVRTNLDYDIVHSVMLSWQNQSEMPISKGKRNTGEVRSLVNPDNILVQAESKTYEKVGFHHIGFIHLKHGLGIYNPALRFFEVRAGTDYNYDDAERYDNVEVTPRNYSWQSEVGASISLLPIKLPFELEWDHYRPLAGKNANIVSSSHLVTLKAYYLF